MLAGMGRSHSMSQGATLKTGRFPVQTPLSVLPGFATQPHEATSNLGVKLKMTKMVTIGLEKKLLY